MVTKEEAQKKLDEIRAQLGEGWLMGLCPEDDPFQITAHHPDQIRSVYYKLKEQEYEVQICSKTSMWIGGNSYPLQFYGYGETLEDAFEAARINIKEHIAAMYKIYKVVEF